MLIDFNFAGKYILVVGGGEEGSRKISKFLKEQPKILVVSKTFHPTMRKLHKNGKINLLKAEVKDAEAFIKSLNPKPDLIIAATDDPELNAQLAVHAKSAGCLFYAIDNPAISDFTLPASTEIGDIRVAVSTSGKSPAVARALRKRIEGLITTEDLLQIKLQFYIRNFMKGKVLNQKARRKILYKILRDEDVARLLKEGKYDEACEKAVKIVESYRINVKKEAAIAEKLKV
ncbi:MAG: bifunctional precorrin-2 dehydrogenase/sirohydrochlorin ferrochelatase [Candidatus Bathyarchaeia archaeon]